MYMQPIIDEKITFHVGSGNAARSVRPLPPYDTRVIEFLDAVSARLFSYAEARQHPDVLSFAFWCRRANLHRLAREFDKRQFRLGRGLVFHVAPANVPVNFAFSLAFGLLAGNANMVRISEKSGAQAALLCKAFKEIIDEPTFSAISDMVCVLSYPRDDEITRQLSSLVQARILWGGDSTINHLRQIPMPTRCVEVAFADRYSMCVMSALAVHQADEEVINKLAENFYNDAYLLDQSACSSPQLLIWIGDEDQASTAAERFWGSLETLVKRKYSISAIAAMDKLYRLCSTAIRLDRQLVFRQHGNLIYRLRLQSLSKEMDQYRGAHGMFFEYFSGSADCLADIVNERYQTLTYFGLNDDVLRKLVQSKGLLGIDRIVPVGRALDIGVQWDGYDLIYTLSRVIA
jgi:hypothetical protein